MSLHYLIQVQFGNSCPDLLEATLFLSLLEMSFNAVTTMILVNLSQATVSLRVPLPLLFAFHFHGNAIFVEIFELSHIEMRGFWKL
jgi:hypothetical protein